MSDTAPDIDTLRAFVRDELDAEDQKAIYRWMVRCTDPRLPPLLESLQIEWEQVQADRDLSEAGQRVGQRFLEIWQQGDGGLDSVLAAEAVQEASLSYAFRDTGGAVPRDEGVALVETSDARPESRTVTPQIVAAGSRRRAIGVLVTDAESPKVFFERELEASVEPKVEGQVSPYVFDREDGRATFWYVASDKPSDFGVAFDDIEAFSEFLDSAIEDDSRAVRATRLTRRFLSDLYS